MSIKHVSAKNFSDNAYDILEEDGCLVITDLVNSGDLGSLTNELEPIFNITPNSKGIFHGYNTRRFGGIVKKAPASHKLITHPVILKIMDEILGLHCSRYQLSLTQAIRIYPGEQAQIIHTDDTMYPFSHPLHQSMVNVMWACSDFTAQNGATRLISGSHLWDEEKRKDPKVYAVADKLALPAEMPKGSALIYYGSLWHSGGANNSDAARTGLVFSYNLGWLRQAENQYLSVPKDIAKTLSRKLRELVGYAIHEPNLGWYEGQSPEHYLSANTNEPMATEDHFTPEQSQILKAYAASLTAKSDR